MELRQLTQAPTLSNNRTVRGYAAVFNSASEVLTENGKTFREVILPGAFRATLAAQAAGGIVALWNHDRTTRPPLGRTSAGTLRLWEDARGLAYEVDLPEAAADVLEAIRRGDVAANSFGFRNEKARWYTREGQAFRDVESLDLVEISFVTWPAYPAAGPIRSKAEPPEPEDLSRPRARLALAELDLMP